MKTIFFAKSMRLLLLAFVVSSCFQIRMNDRQIQNLFATNTTYQPLIKRYTVQNRTIRYVEAGKDTNVLVVFIHGSPGSIKTVSHAISNQLLLEKFKVIAMDKPGYGFSDFGIVETSLEKQVALIKPILEENRPCYEKIIVVGSSYGGSLAARLAMDLPELVDGLVFSAASLAPYEEKVYGISHLIKLKFFKWMSPMTLQMANDEKLAHAEELRKMIPLWKNITVPVIILQGEADDLIFPGNADFAEKMLVNAPKEIVLIPNQSHLILYEHPEIVLGAIERLVPQTQDFLTRRLSDKTIHEK